MDRFWLDFGSQNRSKIDPKRVPKGVGNHGRFCMPSGTCKNRFFGQHGPNLAPKMAPSWSQNGTKIGPKRLSEAKSAPELIFDRFWIDFWSILGRFWVDFGTIFGRFWEDLGYLWWILVGQTNSYKHVRTHVRIEDTRTRFASFLSSLTPRVSASLSYLAIRFRQHVKRNSKHSRASRSIL